MEKIVLGKVYIGDLQHVLFQVYEYNEVYISEILLLKDDGTLTLLISDANSSISGRLNFSPTHQIEAIYRLRQGCEKTIYWVDQNNIPRRFIVNTEKLSYFTENSVNDNTKADANKFCLISMYNGLYIPVFDTIDVVEGGYLTSGSYNISCQYLDADFNPTEWINTTDTIIIYNDTQSKAFSEIRGSTNTKNDYQNFGVTSKAIRVKVTNLDTNFKYIRFALIQASVGTGLPNKVLASQELLITEEGVTYTFTEQSLLTTLTTEEIIAFANPVYQAKTIEQLDNMLLLGNTKGKQINWCKLQKYASKIKSNVVYKPIDLNTINNTVVYPDSEERTSNKDFKRGVANIESVGYMPGETYSFGLIYLFEDGFQSPVFHIPGPPPALFTENASRISKNTMRLAQCEDFRYTNTTCEEDYWGQDYLGNDLEGLPIRHHKFPLRTEANEPLLLNDRTYRNSKKRRFYFYIQFRRNLIPGIKPVIGDVTKFTNVVEDDLKNIHFPPGTAGDASGGGVLSYTYYNRFKKNFSTIKLILRVTYQIGNAYTTELIEHEVSADEVIRPKGNKDLTDTWGIKYVLPEVPESYNLVQVVVLEIPQVQNADTDDGDKQIWFTTGDRSKAEVACEALSHAYCLNYLSFSFLLNASIYSWAHLADSTKTNIYSTNAPLQVHFGNEGGASQIIFYGPGGLVQAGTPKKLVSYLNPCPVIYKEEYYDVEDTTNYTSKIMGVQFSNIEVPDITDYVVDNKLTGNKIVGYKIVRNERTGDNKTILDSGVLLPVLQQSKNIDSDYFVSASLLNPIFNGTWESEAGHNVLKGTQLNQYNFSFLSAEHKFLKKEYNDDTIELLIQGVYDINNNNEDGNSQMCLSTNNDKLFIQEGVEVGTSYNPEINKKGEVDYDGWDLHLINKHIFIEYQKVTEEVKIDNINKLIYIPPMEYDSLPVGLNKELPVYNLSMDNAVGIVNLQNNTNRHLYQDYLFKQITEEDDLINNTYYGQSPATFTSLFKVRFPYVYMYRYLANPYAFFNILPYYLTSINPVYFNGYSNSSTTVFGGDVYTSPIRYRNDIFYDCRTRNRDRKSGFWQIIGGILGAIVGVVVTVLGAIYSGGVLAAVGVAIISASVSLMISGINILQANNAFVSFYNAGLQTTIEDLWITQILANVNPADDEIQWISECLDTVWLESTVNMNWRNGVSSYITDYENPLTGYHLEKTVNYLLDKLTTMDSNNANGRLYMGFAKAEFYQMNLDYMRRNKEKIFHCLSNTYDCCSDCKESTSLRVHYSQQSFQEEKTDNYRVFLPNNYRDVPGEKGEITKLVTFQNNLIALTTEGLWKFPKNQQREVVDQIISFIGTGSYFNIPPLALVDENNGNSAGCLSQWGVIKTPYGICYISEDEGVVYQLDDKLTPLSANGMNNWFINNTEFTIPNQDLPSSSTGFIMGYDPQNERMLITKKDYLDSSLTQENGWTISYNFKTKAWTSFHSYLPNIYIYDTNHLYSWKRGEDITIWKHNIEGNYQTFYNTYYPHIIEYVDKSENLKTELWDNITFYTEGHRYYTDTVEGTIVTGNYEDKYATFTNVILYNSKQCSGLLNLISKDNMEGDYFTAYNVEMGNPLNAFLDKNEQDWSLNNFRDLVDTTNIPLWVDNKILNDRWMTQNSMNGYIDKSLHPGVISTAKSWFNQEPFRDKYLVQRFILNSVDCTDLKLVTNFILNQKTISNE